MGYTFKGWSYSTLTNFETCARNYYHLKVAKDVADRPGPALQHGSAVHKALENRLAINQPLPAGMRKYEKHIRPIEKAKGDIHTELKMALTRDLAPTGFFAKDVWVRAVSDVTVISGTSGVVFDWKTGRKRDNNLDQMDLCSAVSFQYFSKVEDFKSCYVWLDDGVDGSVTARRHYRDDVEEIFDNFMPRVQRMEQAFVDNKWPAKECFMCKWCPVHRCEFNRARR